MLKIYWFFIKVLNKIFFIQKGKTFFRFHDGMKHTFHFGFTLQLPILNNLLIWKQYGKKKVMFFIENV
jgi:hypothetical protein